MTADNREVLREWVRQNLQKDPDAEPKDTAKPEQRTLPPSTLGRYLGGYEERQNRPQQTPQQDD
jgi:hypothetical protein